MHVIVIGAGLVGLTLAHQLRERGADVTLVEAGRVGAGCSHGNAGWVCSALSAPLPSPGVFRHALTMLTRPSSSPLSVRLSPRPDLLSWLWRFWRSSSARRFAVGLRAMLALSAEAADHFNKLARSGVRFELFRSGLLAGILSEEGLERSDQTLEELTASGYRGRTELVSEQRLRTLEPAFSDSVVGGIYFRDEQHVRPETLVTGLAAALTRNGARVLEQAAVTELRRVGTRWLVRTRRGSFRSDAVVVTAGMGSVRLLDAVGVSLPLQSGRGYSITSVGAGTSPRHPLYVPELKVGCSPYGEQVRLVGTFELGARRPDVHLRPIRRITRAWEQCMRSWRPGDDRVEWAGLRPVTPDGLPVIGEVPGRDGLYVSTGHAMLGVTLAPASASLLATYVLSGAKSPVLEPFAMQRFTRSTP